MDVNSDCYLDMFIDSHIKPYLTGCKVDALEK